MRRRDAPGRAGDAAGSGIWNFTQHLPDTTTAHPAPAANAAPLIRLRRQRHVERLYRLGPRAVFELLDELDRVHRLTDLDARLARYAAVDPEILRALGANRFPERQFRLVGGAP